MPPAGGGGGGSACIGEEGRRGRVYLHKMCSARWRFLAEKLNCGVGIASAVAAELFIRLGVEGASRQGGGVLPLLSTEVPKLKSIKLLPKPPNSWEAWEGAGGPARFSNVGWGLLMGSVHGRALLVRAIAAFVSFEIGRRLRR